MKERTGYWSLEALHKTDSSQQKHASLSQDPAIADVNPNSNEKHQCTMKETHSQSVGRRRITSVLMKEKLMPDQLHI